MNYCLVENGAIVDGPRGLPKSWRNVSGLNLMDPANLLKLGWLPCRIDEGTGGDKMGGSKFLINATEVVEVKQWAPFSDADKQEIERQAAENIRSERNAKLTASDWTQLDDTPLNGTAKSAWATYRQGLRDITTQAGFPFSVTWPDLPV